MGSPPTKILRILTRLNIGGPAIHAALLSTQLDPQRFSTCLVIGEPDPTEGDLSSLVEGNQVRMVRVRSLRRPIQLWADLMAFGHLLRIVWQERPRVIHTHMAKAGTLGRLAGILYNRIGPGRTPGVRAVLIHTFHGHVLEGYFPSWLSRGFLAIERWLARRTDCLIAVSETVWRELCALGIGRPDQWRVIPVGLDLSSLAQLEFPNGSTQVRFGMVGRLVPIKNPRLFLEALQRLTQEEAKTSVSGVIVGDGPLRRRLEAASKTLGLQVRVRFTGWQRDLLSVYSTFEVACLTS